jgi:uncharacterized protein YjiS (DUF1127 family)
MTAPFPKHQLAPAFPTTITPSATIERRHHRAGLGQRLGRAITALRGRQAVFNELQSLSDRELSDIGIARSDIHRVFDPAFAAEHRARG